MFCGRPQYVLPEAEKHPPDTTTPPAGARGEGMLHLLFFNSPDESLRSGWIYRYEEKRKPGTPHGIPGPTIEEYLSNHTAQGYIVSTASGNQNTLPAWEGERKHNSDYAKHQFLGRPHGVLSTNIESPIPGNNHPPEWSEGWSGMYNNADMGPDGSRRSVVKYQSCGLWKSATRRSMSCPVWIPSVRSWSRRSFVSWATRAEITTRGEPDCIRRPAPGRLPPRPIIPQH